jgi:hypothetical protein
MTTEHVTITITDCGTRSVYRLAGASLEMTRSGGCRDVLAEGGIVLGESMDDATIERVVRAAWVTGYDGDPEANGLGVHVERTEG